MTYNLYVINKRINFNISWSQLDKRQNVKEVIGWSVVKRIPMNVWHRLIKLKHRSKVHLLSFGAVSLHMDCAINSMSVLVGRPAMPSRRYSNSSPRVIITLVASWIKSQIKSKSYN